jgi:hypothetical protein
MCNKEIEKLDLRLKAYGKKIASSKQKSEEFLYKIGVTTKKGELTERYKDLCTQPNQD